MTPAFTSSHFVLKLITIEKKKTVNGVAFLSHRFEDGVHQLQIAQRKQCVCLNSCRLAAHRLAPTALQADKCSERGRGCSFRG